MKNWIFASWEFILIPAPYSLSEVMTLCWLWHQNWWLEKWLISHAKDYDLKWWERKSGWADAWRRQGGWMALPIKVEGANLWIYSSLCISKISSLQQELCLSKCREAESFAAEMFFRFAISIGCLVLFGFFFNAAILSSQDVEGRWVVLFALPPHRPVKLCPSWTPSFLLPLIW